MIGEGIHSGSKHQSHAPILLRNQSCRGWVGKTEGVHPKQVKAANESPPKSDNQCHFP